MTLNLASLGKLRQVGAKRSLLQTAARTELETEWPWQQTVALGSDEEIF